MLLDTFFETRTVFSSLAADQLKGKMCKKSGRNNKVYSSGRKTDETGKNSPPAA